MLDGIALFFIFFMIIALAAIIVVLGSLPGKIARKRGHPHPDAVNAASWIGLATGVFWPVAFIWAFLPCPSGGGTDAPGTDVAKLQERLAALESTVAKLQSKRPGGCPMIMVMTICYIGCVFVAFKVIKLKVTPVSVAIAALIGVFMLGGVVIGWKQSAPMTGQMMLRRHVLEVIPDVREFVSKVHVKSNEFVKKGDPLFEILPDRFQGAVEQATAQLAAAQATVTQCEAAVAAAEAAVRQSDAETGAVKAKLDTALAVQKDLAGAIARLKVEEAEQAYRASEADGKVVDASLKQAQFSLAGARHSVDVAQAALNTANFNLERCTYASPVDGQVMNWQITEGTPVARWRFVSTGTVMDLSDTAIIGVFPQNLLKNVKSGNAVEIAFKRRPGEIATGKVEAVVKCTGEGQFLPQNKLPEMKSVGSKGALVVRIRLDDAELAKKLPLGAAGTVAVYTDFGKAFHLISKVTIRIKGWLYYLPI